jgi:hypothetical protein
MGRQPREWRRTAIEHVGERLERRRAGEGQPFGGHVIEHDAEREQVASGIERSLQDPFGRHVVRGAERPSGNGRLVERRRRDFSKTNTPGQPEVEHLHAP